MRSPERLLSRVREADPLRFDLALAAVLIGASLIEVAALSAKGHSRPLSAVVCVALLAPLALRRRYPLEVVGLVALVLLVNTRLDTMVMDNMTTPFLALGVVFYTLGRYTRGRATLTGLGMLYASVAAVTLTLPDSGGFLFAMLWALVLLMPPLLVGRVTRRRLEMQAELVELTARLEAEKDKRAERAVQAERGRIAQELQTLVANNVSAMVVQAGVVRPALAASAPATAATALATIEETGRDALVEMRRLLGVLRKDGERAALAPQPSLQRAEALVERARETGLGVELVVQGERNGLSAGVDLAAYRVLQEALESATHASGASRARVELTYGDRDVTVTVGDDRGSGQSLAEGSLTSLRERVDLYGGSLRAGPRRDGDGFRISARLPREVGR